MLVFMIKPKDYTDSSFDRGHMIPAADFSHSQEALASTFTMANICPQDPHLNKNYWAKFESWIRFLFYHNKGNETPISNYLIKVEQLEMIAGLKFFPNDLSDVNREFLDSLIPDSRYDN
eukprot:gene18084-23732_t